MSLTSGPYLARLTALRDLLAERLLDAGARDTSAIARQLAEVDARIDHLSAPEASDDVDEIAQRRAARRAAASARESS